MFVLLINQIRILKYCKLCIFSLLNLLLRCKKLLKYFIIPKEPSVLKEHNLNLNRLCKLEKWSKEAEILVCCG